MAVKFYHLVTMALTVSKRTRPNLWTDIASLRTKVKVPANSDWKKSAKLKKYLQGTSYTPLFLEDGNTRVLKRYIK